MKSGKKTVGTVWLVLLMVLLAAIGFMTGYSYMETVPLEEPIPQIELTVSVSGAAAEDCVTLIHGELVANRLVENLMLSCTWEEMRQMLWAEKLDAQTVRILVNAEKDGPMSYLEEELPLILQEELAKEHSACQVQVTDVRTTLKTTAQRHSLAAAAGGTVLGVLVGVIVTMVVPRKQKVGKYMKQSAS